MDFDKPNILIFATAYYPFFSGAEVAVREITNRIENKEFHLITARLESGLLAKEKIDNVTVYRVGFGSKLDKFLLPILGLPLALRLHKKYNYEIAWSLMASQASVLAAIFKIIKSKVRLLVTLQEGDEEEYLKRYALGSNIIFKILIRPFHRLAIKQADHIQAISNYLKERALKAGAKCPITIIPNGVNFDLFKRVGDNDVNELKKNIGISEDKIVIITHGRMAEKNAFDDIIRALQYLPEQFIFLCIGLGEQKEMLHNLVNQLNLQPRVIFIDEKYTPQDQLAPYLSIGNIYCRPSLSEGLGNSLLEAMAFQMPVIATQVGGIVDFIKDYETGIFCEVRNPRSIANKAKMLSDDKSLYNKIASAGYSLVNKDYSWNIISEKMDKIINSIIDA